MSRFQGYTGKILDIDLTSGRTGEYTFDDRDRELFIGGRYISTKILWDELEPGTDPLSPGNILVIMTSPLTGSGAPSASRYDISAKSPLTGGIGHSNSGGDFGIFLKKAGWDGIVVRGRSPGPVYLDIDETGAALKDASHMAGMNTQDAQAAMGEQGTLAIGPAGEHLVPYATVVSQERSHGRTGMGAVMGSKNLKGMIARGSRKTPLYRPEQFKKHCRKWVQMLRSHPATGDQAPRLGTAGFLTVLSRHNALPTRNFTSGSYEDAHLIGGEYLAENHLVRNYGCRTCPIRCGRLVEVDGKEVKGPEYEVLCLLGSNLLINDMEAIIRWNLQLDLLGIDTISVGAVLGFAAELNERGLWDNGIEFGKKDNIADVIGMIARREGIGDDLAGGVRFLSQKYGGTDYAPHVKGLELAAYEPRASVGHGLGYATAPRGACHLDGGYLVYFEVTGPVTLGPLHYRSKPAWAALDQDLLAVISAAGSCLFTSWTFIPAAAFRIRDGSRVSAAVSRILTHAWPLIRLVYLLPGRLLFFHVPLLPHSKALHLATGMKMNFGRFMRAGARGYNLEKLFNLREGIGREQDSLPEKFTREPLLNNDKRSVVRLDKMLPAYYRLRGWDADGVPKKRTLKKLGLDAAVKNRTTVR